MTRNVLIAEQDPVFATLLANAFYAQGHRVKVVGTGLECRDLLRHFPPDLLVVSEDLPWGSGLGVLETLEDRDHPAAKVPVILLLAAGAKHLIFPARFPELTIFSKPITPCEILDSAREVLVCGVRGGLSRWMD